MAHIPEHSLSIIGQDPDTFPVYIKNITLYNRGDKLKIDVEFVLKQYFTTAASNSSIIGTRESFFNKLNVLVVVTSDDALAISIYADRTKLKDFLNSNQDNGKVSRGVYPLQEAVLGDVALSAGLSTTQAQQYGDLYGTDLLFRKSFEVPGAAPPYLSIFAVPIVDTNEDNDTSVIDPADVLFGKTVSELVIKNSIVNLETNLFYPASVSSDDPSLSLWVGDVHQDQGARWRTGDGSGGSESGNLLRVQKTINSKIVDQRNLARVERHSFDFNKLSGLTTANKAVRDRLKTLEKVRKQKPSYLSPLYFSKNENNDLSLYFGFDYLEAVVNGAKYEALYNNVNDKLTSCNMESIRVIRRRVNKPNVFNKLTGGDSPLRLFDKRVEVVGEPQRMDYNTSTGVMQYQIRDNSIKDITTGLYEYGVEITIEDKSRDKILQILTKPDPADPGIDLLIVQLERFLSTSLLSGNYNITTNRYTPLFIEKIKSGEALEYIDPATGAPRDVDYGAVSDMGPIEQSLTTTAAVAQGAIQQYSAALQNIIDFGGQPAIGGMGVITGTEGQELVSQTLARDANIRARQFGGGVITIVVGAPWSIAVNKYLTAMGFFFGPQTLQEQMNLFIAVNPLITGPSGIEFLIRLLRDFSSSLRSAIGVTKGSTTSMTQAPAAPTTGGKKIFTIRQFFLESIDTDALRPYGLDFLNTKRLLSVGSTTDAAVGGTIKRLTFDQWGRLVANETGKNDGVTQQGAIFLTPNFLRIPGRKPLDIFSDNNTTKNAIEEAFYEILSANINKNSPITFASTPGLKATNPALQHTNTRLIQNQNGIMHFNNCVATVFQNTPQNPIKNVFNTPATTEDLSANAEKGLDASNLFSLNSEFITEPEREAAAEALSGSAAINLLQPGAGGSTSNLATQLVANVSQISNYLTQGDFFNGKPNPIVPALTTLSAGNFFVGGAGLPQVQAQVEQGNMAASLASSPALSSPAFANPATTPLPPPAPSEMAFINEVSDGNIDPGNTALIAARYGFVYIVEYMHAYMLGGVGSIVTAPVWYPLTLSVVQAADTGNRSLMCRLKRHKTHLANFDGLKMPIYNELFVIGGEGAVLELPNPSPTQAVAITYGVPSNIAANIDSFSDSIEFANSYDTDTRVGTNPTAAVAYAAQQAAAARATAAAAAQAQQAAAAAAAAAAAEATRVAAAAAATTTAAATMTTTTTGYAAAQQQAPTTPGPPPSLTGPERVQVYIAFYRWYKELLPNGKRRWQAGSHRPIAWPPPRSANSDRDRGVRTLKQLWFGWHTMPRRRNVITIYENQTGITIPTRVFEQNDNGQDY